MKTGMTIQTLLEQVRHNAKAKRDFVASTAGSVRMVQMAGFRNDVALVLLKAGAGELDRFEVNDTAHGQIAAHLGIPFKYYQRLLKDHKDLVIEQVNKLFEREPSTRLVRTIDGHVRAFLSDRYARIDNDFIVANALPVLTRGDVEYTNELLSCNVSDEALNIKCVYTDPKLSFDVGTTRDGRPDTIQPGFHLGNNEVGKGSLFCRSFFHRGYCRNGAVYGSEDILEFRRSHLGGKLIEGADFQILSDETKKLDDATLVSALTDVMKALANPVFINQMADNLRSLKAGTKIVKPIEGMTAVARELELNETETSQAIENLIRDGDYSRWGVLNAVTAIANDAETYERATELETLATKVINLPIGRWETLRQTEAVALKAAA